MNKPKNINNKKLISVLNNMPRSTFTTPDFTQQLLINEVMSSTNRTIANGYRFGTCPIIYQSQLCTKDDGVWDGPDGIDAFCTANGLTPQYDGFLTLDWEGDSVASLDAGDLDVRTQFLLALAYAKVKLPHAKIGYYGFPKDTYYANGAVVSDANVAADPTVYNINAIYEPILRASGVWFPSIYQYYPETLNATFPAYIPAPGIPANNIQYVSWNIKNFIRMRETYKINTPIYPYVWPRWHPNGLGNVYPAQFRIPDNEFQAQCRLILTTNYSNTIKRVDGLVWWGSDAYDISLARVGTYGHQLAITTELGADPAGWNAANYAQQLATINVFKTVFSR